MFIKVHHSFEAQRSVLGAIILGNSTLVSASSILKREDFFKSPHPLIFRTMQSTALALMGGDDVDSKKLIRPKSRWGK